jgi:arginyl-tRNA synthetase
MLKQTRAAVKNALVAAGLWREGLKYTVEIPPAVFAADVSTNAALILAGMLKKKPPDTAEMIIGHLKKEDIVADAWFKSGFVNIKLTEEFLHNQLPSAITDGKNFGKSDTLQGRKLLVEFVSANPTGPLHIGHGRGAVYGDSLARVLQHLGADVKREYYINNVGNQMDVLAASVRSYIEKKPLPENGYKGKYIEDIAAEITSSASPVQDVKKFTIDRILFWIQGELKDLGVSFDTWFPESALYEKGDVARALGILKDKGIIYEQEGALWFKSTAFADDKDRVILRGDGRYTYLASDIAYHMNKLERGFDEMIDIWGADHHGYVARMKGSVSALGYDADRLRVILYQLVNIIRGGKKVTMSTRSGEFVTLREVLDEVGRDAVRFFMMMRSSESHLDFDLDLAKKQAPENPVFYVQYAHARICSIFREAEKQPGLGAWKLRVGISRRIT